MHIFLQAHNSVHLITMPNAMPAMKAMKAMKVMAAMKKAKKAAAAAAPKPMKAKRDVGRDQSTVLFDFLSEM